MIKKIGMSRFISLLVVFFLAVSLSAPNNANSLSPPLNLHTGSTQSGSSDASSDTQDSNSDSEVDVGTIAQGSTFYVRIDGGTKAQCTGLTDAAYPGSGTGQDCAYSHPFWLLPPMKDTETELQTVMQGGDTLIIGPGDYMMGYGAPNTGSSECYSAWAYNCVAQAIPPGPDAEHPTKIYGAGWVTKATAKPELWGTERARQVLNIAGGDNIDIRYLELTDHEDCTYNGPEDTVSNRCNRSTFPRGDHADYGIMNDVAGSSNVTLKDLDIHGFSIGAIKSGGISDWLIESVTMKNNSFVGWEGDIGDPDSYNSGVITFKDTTIQYSGCSETYPGGEPTNCYSQEQGGYGDGIGTGPTGGDWVFDNTNISYNVSDGLDLLYLDGSGSVTITQSRFESNAGNQIKVADDLTMDNSVIIGNCEYFATTRPDLPVDSTIKFDHCRAGGDTFAYVVMAPGQQASLINNTILSRSTVMIMAKGASCDGTEEFVARNNIFYGDRSYLKSLVPLDVKPDLFYQAGSDGNGSGTCGPTGPNGGVFIDAEYSLAHNTKNGGADISSVTNLYTDPLFVGPLFIGEDWNVSLQNGSPAIDKTGLAVGSKVLGTIVVPVVDFYGFFRPQNSLIDWGAIQYGSFPQ